MGDADVALYELDDVQLDNITGALDNFRDELTTLHAVVSEIERRVARYILERTRAYMIFRDFLIAMNIVFIPVVMALGLSYILKGMVQLEPQSPLHGLIEFLWFIAALIGAPLYFGSIWAIYSFTQPGDFFNEFTDSGMDEEIDDFELAMLIRQMFNGDEAEDNERLENQLEENSGNEADDEDDEFVVLGSNQELVQNDSDLPAARQNVSESAIENTTSVTEEQDNNIENQNDNMPVVLPSQVDGVLVVAESEDAVTSTVRNNS